VQRYHALTLVDELLRILLDGCSTPLQHTCFVLEGT